MKWMIASDLHGSATYCRQLLDAFAAEKPGRLLLLGDLLYHGPRNDLPDGYAPKQVLQMLNEMRQWLVCVRGNCDTEVDQMVLQFPILSEMCLLELDGHLVFATHGHHHSEQNPPLLQPGDLLLCGHTHVPACRPCGEFQYLNPGSVSIPKENSPRGYMIYENGLFQWKDLSGTPWKQWRPGQPTWEDPT